MAQTIGNASTDSFDTESSVIAAIKQYLENGIAGGNVDAVTVMLIAGKDSYKAMRSTGDKIVFVDQPNPESPKHLFRVVMKDTPTQEAFRNPTVTHELPKAASDTTKEHNDETYRQMCDRLVATYAPLVSGQIQSEITDEAERAVLAMSFLM